MSAPISDDPSKPVSSGTPPTTAKPATKSFADVHKKNTSTASHGGKKKVQSLKEFLGKDYDQFVKTLNTNIVGNIQKERKKEKKISDRLKAASTGGNMWDV